MICLGDQRSIECEPGPTLAFAKVIFHVPGNATNMGDLNTHVDWKTSWLLLMAKFFS